MRQKINIVLMVLICAALIASCGKKKNIVSEELSAKILENVKFAENLTQLDEAGAMRYYNINPSDCKSITAYVGTKAVCDEYVIIETGSPKTVKSKLEEYIERKKASYSSYRSGENAKLDNVVLEEYKGSVVMIVSPDSGNARAVYEEYLKK